MYLAPRGTEQLGGFNPLKAIGRALGATGRAIVGGAINTVAPGAGSVFTAVTGAAAKMPAGKSGAPVAPPVDPSTVTLPATSPPAAAPVATANTPGATPSATDQLMQAALLKFVTQQPVAAASPTPVIQSPGAPNVVVTAPSAPAAAASALPSWALPAMLGFGALILMQSKK